jgi:hypothetical protein
LDLRLLRTLEHTGHDQVAHQHTWKMKTYEKYRKSTAAWRRVRESGLWRFDRR